jgi:Zn-finger nucleic acid-binding protein
MNCPIDRAELIAQTRNGVTAEVCPACSGLWLDPHNLEASILSRSDSPTEARESPEALEGARRCPVDPRDELIRRTFFGIQIDTCPQHHGAWFDSGELEALIPKWKKAMANSDFQVDKTGRIKRRTGSALLMKLIVGRVEQNDDDWVQDLKEQSSRLGDGLDLSLNRVFRLFLWHTHQLPGRLKEELRSTFESLNIF